VTVVFGSDEFRWTFARDLLDGGGLGDVKVTHDTAGDTTSITISNPETAPPSATVVFPSAPIAGFLREVRQVCPDTAVTYDVDSWLREVAP
jgi:hypothetical protein